MAFRLFLCAALLLVPASCSRPPDLVGIDNDRRPVAQVQAATRRTVFIATTRQASEVTGVFYSDRRAPKLGFASVTVSIPPGHQPGRIERAKRLPPDPETEFAIVDPAVFEKETAFVAALDRELAKLPPADRHLLLFVHGYNNTVSDSLLRIAQFVEDTGYRGVPVLFSWASAARTTRYVYDLNSALVARPRLIEAALLLGRSKAVGVSIFAHSMGTFLTMEAVLQAQLAGFYNSKGKIDNVMLASPDIDIDLFKTQMAMLPEGSRNFTVFVSQDDSALSVSRRLSGGVDRVGAADVAQLENLGVTIIDLSGIEDSTSGSHSKFAGSPEVVQLIGVSLKNDNYQHEAASPTLIEVLGGAPVLRVLGD